MGSVMVEVRKGSGSEGLRLNHSLIEKTVTTVTKQKRALN